MAHGTRASPGPAQVFPWDCHPQRVMPVLHMDISTCSSILPCLEWICQPTPLSCTVLLFSQYSLVLYTHDLAVGVEVCTHSLDDDMGLSSSTLSPCYLKHCLHLVSLRRHRLNALPLLFLRQAGWLLPAPLTFMHTHVHPQLSHTLSSYILPLCLSLARLGLTGFGTSPPHVQLHGCPPEPS